MAVRQVIGLRTPGHSLVKLLAPSQGPAVLVGSYTHPEYVELMLQTLAQRKMYAVLSRGLEGEVACDPRRQPRYDGVLAGEPLVLAEQQSGTAAEVPGLPSAIDVASTAAYTRAVLAGELPVPAALAQQVRLIVGVAQRALDASSSLAVAPAA